MYRFGSRRYIGVTGFTDQVEVLNALDIFPRHIQARLMVGVLVSGKSLRGVPTRYPHRYPEPSAIARIFPSSPQALNIIHYSADSDDNLQTILNDLMGTIGGLHCEGVQLNLAWPNPESLEHFRRTYPTRRLILQIGQRALTETEGLEETVARLRNYQGFATDILFDLSGGRGREIDLDLAERFLLLVERVDFTDLSFGIAGGLSAESLPRLRSLLRRFPHVSIDAESRLRTPDDRLDPAAVESYLSAAGRIFLENSLRHAAGGGR